METEFRATMQKSPAKGGWTYVVTDWTAEFFGFPGTNGANGSAPFVGFLTGPTFTVREWFVLDAGVIIPVAGPQAHALYAGLTWNVGRLWSARATAPSPSR